MTYTDLAQQVRALPRPARLALLQELARSLVDKDAASSRTPSLARVRGMLKTDAPAPTDKRLRDAYIQYLLEKYQ